MNQALEYLNARKKFCKSSNPMPSKTIAINGAMHAGVVTHVCSLYEKHKGECVCKCGAQWEAHR